MNTITGCTPLREACLSTVAEGRVYYVFAPVTKRKPYYTVTPYGGAPAPQAYKWLFENGLIRRAHPGRDRAQMVLTKAGEAAHRGEIEWKPAGSRG